MTRPVATPVPAPRGGDPLVAAARAAWSARGTAALRTLITPAPRELADVAALIRLAAELDQADGRPERAAEHWQRLRALRPRDAAAANDVGACLAACGRLGDALAAFRDAVRLDAGLAAAWLNLGRALDRSGDAAAACAAFEHAIALVPAHADARVLRAECLKTLGRIGDAEAALREALRIDAASVSAWIALARLRGFRMEPAEINAVARLHADPGLTEARRADLGFVYASLLETAGRHRDAFAVLRDANAVRRRRIGWNAAAVGALVDEILAAFAAADTTADAEVDPRRGAGVVFLVGMPRSGSTLAEQILAAHPQVAAGGEREDVFRVLQQESQRRGRRFPTWVGDASSSDWARLGDEYLRRVATERRGRSHFTDKTLANWQTLGAIRRMLPGARVVYCVRDPLETCWSCYKRDFGEAQRFAYDFAELAAFQRDCERAMRAWRARDAERIREHRYEALAGDPVAAVRALLAHVGLDFDAACLRFHEAAREVRTASAAQVRAPLRPAEPVAPRYGALLDPLRAALAAP